LAVQNKYCTGKKSRGFEQLNELEATVK